MASELRRAVRIAVSFALCALAMFITPRTSVAAAAWWNPAGLPGVALSAVSASGDRLEVRTSAGTTLQSSDRGAHFSGVPGNPPLAKAVVSSGGITWSIDGAGRVLAGGRLDSGSPDLGEGAHLIASPATLPGVVVAVAADGTVWRRAQDGDWQRALLLLPQSMMQGVPRVTSVAAFSQPLSDTVYLGTDGYAVLDSTNGGDDWIRAGPGLPDSVSGLATDAATKSVYAATSDGLWVHVLQSLPAPPEYRDAALLWRWVGIGLVTAIASLLTVLGLARALRTTATTPP